MLTIDRTTVRQNGFGTLVSVRCLMRPEGSTDAPAPGFSIAWTARATGQTHTGVIPDAEVRSAFWRAHSSSAVISPSLLARALEDGIAIVPPDAAPGHVEIQLLDADRATSLALGLGEAVGVAELSVYSKSGHCLLDSAQWFTDRPHTLHRAEVSTAPAPAYLGQTKSITSSCGTLTIVRNRMQPADAGAPKCEGFSFGWTDRSTGRVHAGVLTDATLKTVDIADLREAFARIMHGYPVALTAYPRGRTVAVELRYFDENDQAVGVILDMPADSQPEVRGMNVAVLLECSMPGAGIQTALSVAEMFTVPIM
jgi:hypothetical protein